VHYSRYVLDTTGGTQAILARLHPNHVRRGIRKAEKQLVLERAGDVDAWRTMARLQQETSRRHGLPAPPDRFFVDSCRRLQEQHLAALYLARNSQGRAVAAVVVWIGPREWIYAFGASRPDDWELRPNHLLLWGAIQDAAAAGAAFDFGRAAPEQRGLVEFKQHWGGVPEPLSYDFWPRASGLDTLPRDRGPLALAARAWARLPLSLTRRASALYRYLA
jgi:lipid II:glycine glycyltransferase (peptidoglycan interpeptide bridge formation enzyme)